MNKFIVMQNATHDEEVSGGYMWSPQKDKSGASNHAYERMATIKACDMNFIKQRKFHHNLFL